MLRTSQVRWLTPPQHAQRGRKVGTAALGIWQGRRSSANKTAQPTYDQLGGNDGERRLYSSSFCGVSGRNPGLLSARGRSTQHPGWTRAVRGAGGSQEDWSGDFADDDGWVPCPSNLPTSEDDWLPPVSSWTVQ